MMRNIIIAGNWKMNKTFDEAGNFLKEISDFVKGKVIDNIDIIICPPSLYLEMTTDFADNKIFIGSQNVSNYEYGAYTGEISAKMLKSIDIDYCIIGHSERRKYFNESNQLINEKLKILQKFGIKPIVCIGETLEERESGITEKVITSQLKGVLKNVTINQDVIIAYEPIWAIGTGKTATPSQAQEIHNLIRKWLLENYSMKIAEDTSILYGGSVNPKNIKELLMKPDIDGGLIGGASLDIVKFKEIIRIALEI